MQEERVLLQSRERALAKMNKRNYSKELDEMISKAKACKPKLLLHACCAPCSSYVLQYLSAFFKIHLLYYNPNISPEEEYRYRIAELRRLLASAKFASGIHLIEGAYEPERFDAAAEGLEASPEGGARCTKCYTIRLEEAAREGKRLNCDYFASTLSISPMKNSDTLNRIGEMVGNTYGIKHLPNDFKKRGGYLESVRLSKEYDLYRQDYCGCIHSKRIREQQKKCNDESSA